MTPLAIHPTAAPADHFALTSVWHIDAPRLRVWQALREAEQWPRWWPYVLGVDEQIVGDAQGVGAINRFLWKGRVPYRFHLTLRVTEVVEARLLRAVATGDLHGEGCWTLDDDGAGTRATYVWRVRLERAWMRRLATLLRPLFTWNHNAVMAAGERGLRAYLRAHS